LAAFDTASADIAAGRLMLGRIRELAAARESFAFETTLASRSLAPWIAGLREIGYGFHLYYLWLNSPELAVARVKARHQSGGHLVPEADVRRRYVRSAANFMKSFKPLATAWRFFDNSGSEGPTLVAHGGEDWVDTILEPTTWSRFRSVADETAEQ
jgi:predicted ABC-type ATPase